MGQKHRGNNQSGTGWSPSGMNYPSGYRHPVENDRVAELNAKPAGGFGCWCGETYGHDWEGKADGAPHPRKKP